MPATATPHVAILLCTYNGESFLREQLNSYLAQTHTNWSLWVGDDGSTDGTWAMLEAFCDAHPEHRIVVRHGPAQGFLRNFLTLACDEAIVADYFAYSDQDDIWHADKLTRSITALAGLPSDQPLLYGSRSEFIDESGNALGLSYPYSNPGFAHALAQCIAGGNTMLFNRAARALLQTAGPNSAVASHDWFTYQLVSGAGGHVVFDTTPTIGYRQYSGAMAGSNRGLKPSLVRIRKLLGGTYRNWNALNINRLSELSSLLTAANRHRLEQFRKAHKSWLLPRLYYLARSGARRQTLLGNLGLLFAAVTGRL